MGDGDKCEVEGNLTVLFFLKQGGRKCILKWILQEIEFKCII